MSTAAVALTATDDPPVRRNVYTIGFTRRHSCESGDEERRVWSDAIEVTECEDVTGVDRHALASFSSHTHFLSRIFPFVILSKEEKKHFKSSV